MFLQSYYTNSSKAYSGAYVTYNYSRLLIRHLYTTSDWAKWKATGLYCESLCMYVAFHSCPSFPWIILMALFVFVSIQNLMQGFPNTESCSIFVASSSYSRLHRFEGKTFQIFRVRDI